MLRLKDDGSSSSLQGWYLEDMHQGSYTSTISNSSVSTQTGTVASTITLVTSILFMTTEINNIISGRLCVWWLTIWAWKSDCLCWNAGQDGVTDSILSNLVNLPFHIWKMGDNSTYLEEFLQGINKMRLIIHCAWHIKTTQLMLANMITGKANMSMFGHIPSTQENDTLPMNLEVTQVYRTRWRKKQTVFPIARFANPT